MEKFIYINNLPIETICDEITEKFDSESNSKKSINILIDMQYNVMWTHIKNIVLDEVYKNLNIYYEKLNNNIFFFDRVHDTKTINRFIIHKYNKNECYSTYKNDFFVDFQNKKSRILTFIIFLNTIDEGGELIFFENYKIKPEKGKIVIFPSEWFFPYCEKISLSHDKYIIKGWIYIDI